MFHHTAVQYSSLTLRIGVAFAFLYPASRAVADPDSWVGYFPAFVADLPLDGVLLLHAFGALQVVLALWILSGKHVFYPAAAAVVILAAIVVVNLPLLDILFRDIPIAFAAAALAILHYPGTQPQGPPPAASTPQ